MTRIGIVKIHKEQLNAPDQTRWFCRVRDNGGNFIQACFERIDTAGDIVKFKRTPMPAPRSIMSFILN